MDVARKQRRRFKENVITKKQEKALEDFETYRLCRRLQKERKAATNSVTELI